VHAVGAGANGGSHDQVAAQVGVGRRGTRQPDGDIRLADERRVGIRVAVDGDGAHAPLRCCTEDAARDLPAVGYQHALHSRNTPKPSCTPRISSLPMTDSASPRTVRVSRGSMMPSS
jgi:hypothetical protein